MAVDGLNESFHQIGIGDFQVGFAFVVVDV